MAERSRTLTPALHAHQAGWEYASTIIIVRAATKGRMKLD
jgi:hypothetical protein